MRYEIDLPKYDKKEGLKLEWEYNFRILTSVDTAGKIVIKANSPGLISLARILLSLSQEAIPSGHHIHLDISNSLEDGSVELILERE
jgi:hypothetical protein